MKKLTLSSALCLILWSGDASLRAQMPDHTPVPAVSPAPTPVTTPMLLSKDALKALTGRYAVPGREPATIAVHGDMALTATLANGTSYELFPTQGTTFSIQGVDGGTSEFRRNADGKYDEIVTTMNGETFTALRVEEKPAASGKPITKEMLKAMTGRYSAPDDVTVTISLRGEDGLTATLTDGSSYELTPREGTSGFEIRGVEGSAEFHRDAEGGYDQIVGTFRKASYTATRIR